MLSLSEKNILLAITLISAGLVVGNGAHFLLFRLLRSRQTEKQRKQLGVRRHLARPARLVLLTVSAEVVLPLIPGLSTALQTQLDQIVRIVLILSVGWMGIGSVYVFQAILLSRFDITAVNNLRARRVHTQMEFFRRLMIGIVVLLDGGMLLWSLHNHDLWKYGTGLLASAGLASLMLAAAAKSTASNLIAGLQIALSEPIRMDDVVIVEGEWGRIEEITSTYVVVKIWDMRRLVVPLSYFIENPFQNWTRNTSDLMGTAFLYVDYAIPVEPLREELKRVVAESPLWDGRVCGLQVTNLSERTMELRCLVSSPGSGENFDLRCLVREKMIAYIRDNYPWALPTLRVQAEARVSEDQKSLKMQ
jgi:small-conductance mechanosensitive channel